MTASSAAERLWEADSLAHLLGKMEPDGMPLEESVAIGECQAEAIDTWLAAYAEISREARALRAGAAGVIVRRA